MNLSIHAVIFYFSIMIKLIQINSNGIISLVCKKKKKKCLSVQYIKKIKKRFFFELSVKKEKKYFILTLCCSAISAFLAMSSDLPYKLAHFLILTCTNILLPISFSNLFDPFLPFVLVPLDKTEPNTVKYKFDVK